jgi:enoyl-CoA hydratase
MTASAVAHDGIVVERQDRVVVATLARPPVNAFDGALVAALDALVVQVCGEPDVAVLHIRSEQKVFCAGADLALLDTSLADAAGRDAMLSVVRAMQRAFARLAGAGLVTIAEIGGAALGGGFELALACDLRVAAADAKIGLPEAALGLLPAAGGTQRLTRLCGPALALRLILGAEVVSGDEAARLGLVQWAKPGPELAEWTRALAHRIAGMPKASLVLNKECIHAACDPARDGFALELAATKSLYSHVETRARVAGFLAMRKQRSQEKELT